MHASAVDNKIDLVDAMASQTLTMVLHRLKSCAKFAAAAYWRVIDRALNYHRRFLPEQFLSENSREWSTLVDLC